jgi:hypothetical protein
MPAQNRRGLPIVASTSADPDHYSKQRTNMSLNFPNTSRSFDATRRAIRFWGYDSAMENSFFMTEEALRRLHPSASSDEAGLLRAFDAHRDRILAIARKVYARGRKGSYELRASDV